MKISNEDLITLLRRGIKIARIAADYKISESALHSRKRKLTGFSVSQTLQQTRSFKIPRAIKDSHAYRELTHHQASVLGLLLRVKKLHVSEIAAMHWSVPYSLFECGAVEWKGDFVIATPRGKYLKHYALPLQVLWEG